MEKLIKKTVGILSETTDGELYVSQNTNIKELNKEELLNLAQAQYNYTQSLQHRIETLTTMLENSKAKLDIITKAIAL